jgi:hypothetical protein
VASLRRFASIERAFRGRVNSFRCKDGTTHYFDWNDYGGQLFSYAVELSTLAAAEAEEPTDPPLALRAIWQAEDPQAVLDQFLPAGERGGFFDLRMLPTSEEELMSYQEDQESSEGVPWDDG